MLVPLFNLLTKRPDLIIGHLASYVELAQFEMAATKARTVRRAIAGAVALVFAVAAVVLTGVAIMLATVAAPQTQTPQLSVFVVVPSASLLIALVAGAVALRNGRTRVSPSLADHVQRDFIAFRQLFDSQKVSS